MTGRAKLRLCWGEDEGKNLFAAKGLVEVSGISNLWLLPRGKSALIIDHHGDVTLHRMELDDDWASLHIVADIRYGQGVDTSEFEWNKLLTAMSPCTIFVHNQGDR